MISAFILWAKILAGSLASKAWPLLKAYWKPLLAVLLALIIAITILGKVSRIRSDAEKLGYSKAKAECKLQSDEQANRALMAAQESIKRALQTRSEAQNELDKLSQMARLRVADSNDQFIDGLRNKFRSDLGRAGVGAVRIDQQIKRIGTVDIGVNPANGSDAIEPIIAKTQALIVERDFAIAKAEDLLRAAGEYRAAAADCATQAGLIGSALIDIEANDAK